MVAERPIVALAAHTSGTGSPVVVLHGFGWSAEAMRELIGLMEPRHSVIAVDLPGHGASEPPPPGYTMGDFATDLRSTLAVLGRDRVHLCGYSMGGRAALSYAAADPTGVVSMVLVGASAGIADAPARARRAAADDAVARRLERDGIEEFVRTWASQPLLRPATGRGRRSLEGMQPLRLANTPEGLAGALRSLGTGRMPPLHNRLGDLTFPAALVAGERDARYRTISEELAAALPDGRSFVVAGAGHAAHLDDPETVAGIALTLFSRAEGAAE